LEVESLV